MRPEARGKIEEIIFPNKLLISTEEREVPEKLFISFLQLDLSKLMTHKIGHFPSPEDLDKARNILRESSQFFEVEALERRRIFTDRCGKLTMFWTKFPHFLYTEDIHMMIEDLEDHKSIDAFKQRMEEKQKLGCILEKVDVGDGVLLKEGVGVI